MLKSFLAAVLLSASVERVGVSRRLDFFKSTVKTLKVTKNNDFTFLGRFFFVVVKYRQISMFEFNS